MTDERRKTNRARTLLGAKALMAGGGSTSECKIANMSDRGARLVLGEDVFLPDRFELSIPRKQRTMKAIVRWREPGAIGVEFEPEAEVSDDLGRRVVTLEAENNLLRKRLADALKRLDSYGDSERLSL